MLVLRELSILCDCEIAVILFDPAHQLYQYSTRNSAQGMEQIIQRWRDYDGNYEALTNNDLQSLKPGRAASFKTSKKRKTAGGAKPAGRKQPSAAAQAAHAAQADAQGGGGGGGDSEDEEYG